VGVLRHDDLLFITADHGCDPTDVSTDHTREYVPFLIAGPRVSQACDLGTRRTFADLGVTICDLLGISSKGFPGKCALSELQ
jgi:phosphopentomutase